MTLIYTFNKKFLETNYTYKELVSAIKEEGNSMIIEYTLFGGEYFFPILRGYRYSIKDSDPKKADFIMNFYEGENKGHAVPQEIKQKSKSAVVGNTQDFFDIYEEILSKKYFTLALESSGIGRSKIKDPLFLSDKPISHLRGQASGKLNDKLNAVLGPLEKSGMDTSLVSISSATKSKFLSEKLVDVKLKIEEFHTKLKKSIENGFVYLAIG